MEILPLTCEVRQAIRLVLAIARTIRFQPKRCKADRSQRRQSGAVFRQARSDFD